MADVYGPIADLFSAYVVQGVVQRTHSVSSQLIQLLDMGYVVTSGSKPTVKKGSAVTQTPFGRLVNYDIFNPTRLVPPTSKPGQPTTLIDPQTRGMGTATVNRLAIRMEFPHERLSLMRRMGQGPESRDIDGKDEVARQLGIMGQRANAWRLMHVAGMLRNSLYVQHGTNQTGDTLSFTSVAGSTPINFGFRTGQFGTWVGDTTPDSGKYKLDPLSTGTNLISGDWSNSATNIFGDLIRIDQTFQKLYGGRLSIMLMRHNTARYILENTTVKSLAGSVNRPFTEYSRKRGVDANKVPINGFELTLAGIPWVKLMVVDDYVATSVDGSGNEVLEPVIPEDTVIFMDEPAPDYAVWVEGTEPIADGPDKPGVNRTGLYVCSEYKHEPPMHCVKLYDNGIVVVKNPNWLMSALVKPAA